MKAMLLLRWMRESNYLFAQGMVKDWWIKYGTLYIELEDGTVKEEEY